MVMQVLDSSDTQGIIEAAGVETEEANANANAEGSEKKPEADAKGGEDTAKTVEKDRQDDEEDENGLSEEDRAGLTSKMLKTIGKKHRAMKEAEEFAADQYNQRRLAEQRAQQLEEELNQFRQASQPAKQEEKRERPQRDQFKTEAEFLDAVIAFGVEERLTQERERMAKEQAERRQQEIVENATKLVQKARELVPDYDEVVGEADTVVPPLIGMYMQKSELFAELGYYFAKNPDTLESLAKLPPDEQLVKLGKIEDKLQPFGSKTSQSTEAHGDKKPSTETDKKPTASVQSSTRKDAPVFKPIDSSSTVEKNSTEFSIKDEIAAFAKRNQANLSIRKRH